MTNNFTAEKNGNALQNSYFEFLKNTYILKRISSDLYITDQFPPAYVMTAEGDFLRKQAPYMYGKLKEKNVFCELHEYSSPKEKLMHVFHLNMRSEDAKRCNDDECEFFRKFIGR